MSPKDLRKFLQDSGLTQQQFADMMGVNLRSVTSWLNGSHLMPHSAVVVAHLLKRKVISVSDVRSIRKAA